MAATDTTYEQEVERQRAIMRAVGYVRQVAENHNMTVAEVLQYVAARDLYGYDHELTRP